MHFALASRRCNDMVVRADLVRNVTAGWWYPRHVNLTLPDGFKHCVLCFMCKCIIPMPTDPVVVYHQCPHHPYKHAMWSHDSVVVYRGATNHLPQPTPCPAEDMEYYHYRPPTPVFPTAPQLSPLLA
jgi:hypothetical protein